MRICPESRPFDRGKHAVIYTGDGDETLCLRCFRVWPTRQDYTAEMAEIEASELRALQAHEEKLEMLNSFLLSVGFLAEPVLARKLFLLEGHALNEFEEFLEESQAVVMYLRHILYLNIEK